jgi:type II secretory pathway pseudopilin PulG
MLNFLKKRKGERGFTLVEFLVVLGLIFVLVAVLAMAAYKSTQRTRVSRAKSEVMTVVAAAEDWGGNKAKKFSGISMKQLADSGLLSSDLANTKYLNPWGGKYSIKASGTGNTTFTITVDGVPTQQALDLADNLRPVSLDQAHSDAQGGTVNTEFR